MTSHQITVRLSEQQIGDIKAIAAWLVENVSTVKAGVTAEGWAFFWVTAPEFQRDKPTQGCILGTTFRIPPVVNLRQDKPPNGCYPSNESSSKSSCC